MNNSKNSMFLLLAALLFLPSCAGVAAGAGASLGVAAAQEGGIGRAATDARIQIAINDLWFRHNVEMFRKLDITVNQGRVLLTGVVQDPEHRVEAVRLAWQPSGVKQVINEIRVAESDGITGFARDTWITTRLRTSITFDRNIQSINYSIDTVQGIVYLMGFAQNQAELNRVIEKARTIPDVKQVVSYVKLVGEKNTDTAPQSEMPLENQDQGYQDPMYDDQGYQDSGYQNPPYDNGGSDYQDPYGSQPVPITPQDDSSPYQNNQYQGGIETEVLR